MILTDSLNLSRFKWSEWCPFSTLDFVRIFQYSIGIRVRNEVRSMNFALPVKQGITRDTRFKGSKCADCGSTIGPWFSQTAGELWNLDTRICKRCSEFRWEYDSARPTVYHDRWAVMMEADKDKCQICAALYTTFSGNATYIRLFLPELVLTVCRNCAYLWKEHSQMLPINGIHIPENHQWRCEECDTMTSRWFQFTDTLANLGRYLCYDCCVSLGMDAVDKSFAIRFKDHSVEQAGYPSAEKLREPQRQASIRFKRGMIHWAKANYAIDLSSFKTVISQRKADLEAAGVELPNALQLALKGDVGKPVEMVNDAKHIGTGKKRRRTNSQDETVEDAKGKGKGRKRRRVENQDS